jgi:hypothetical protein
MKQLRIERIHILGIKKTPSRVQLVNNNNEAHSLAFDYDDTKASLTIRDPAASVTQCGWSIVVE